MNTEEVNEKSLTSKTLLSIGTQKRLKFLRNHLKMTQKDFSQKARISLSYLASVETENQPPSFSFLYKIASTYNVSLDWLVLEKGDIFIDKIRNKEVKDYIKNLEPPENPHPLVIKLKKLLPRSTKKDKLAIKYLFEIIEKSQDDTDF